MSVQVSLLRHNALAYLGYSGSDLDETTLKTLNNAIDHISEWAAYKQRYYHIKDLPQKPAFLEKEVYKSLSDKLDTALLFAATLGLNLDQRIRSLSLANLSQAVIVNAVANAYLEAQAESFIQEQLPGAVLFCPGYAGTEPQDNRYILELLDAQKQLGIYIKDSGLMLPEKTMVGIIVSAYHFSCKYCSIRSKCPYLKQGRTCYSKKPPQDIAE